jgi:lipopolysaccharide transport system permease protein
MRSIHANPARPLIPHVIAPNQAWFRVRIGELVEHRDLLFLLFRRDLVSRYKQTLLGPAWYILQPLATALVFSAVFGRVIAVPTHGVPRILFYLCGLLAWTFFSQTLHSTAATFSSNADLFGKVHFPRLVVPLAALMSNMVAFTLQFVVFLLFYATHKLSGHGGFAVGWGALLFPLLVLHVAVLGLGTGLWISALTARFRDLKHAMSFMVSMWMFLTPVIYPLAEVPANLRWAVMLNPMGPVAEAFRWSLLGNGTMLPGPWLVSLVVSGLILLGGILLFQRTERTVVDTI